ncbi:Unannotated, partial [Lentimonas sp. CC19]
MKLSAYTFIALLITVISASALNEKPEGEVKRYKITLEPMKSNAASASEVEIPQNEALIDQDANDDIEAAPEKAQEDKSKWWKLWGNEEAERKEADKAPEVGQQKREEQNRKWWKPWSQDAPLPDEAEKEIVTVQEKPEAN